LVIKVVRYFFSWISFLNKKSFAWAWVKGLAAVFYLSRPPPMHNQDKRDDISWAIYIGELLFKQAEGCILDETERADLEEWRQSNPQRMKLFEESQDRRMMVRELRELDERYDTAEAGEHVFWELGIPSGNHISLLVRLRRWAPAAAIMLLVGAGVLFLVSRRRSVAPGGSPVAVHQPEIPPGSNKAVLTLGGGERVILDSARNGQVAQQGNVQIINKNGQLSYTGAGAATGQHVLLNTIATPRGGQYQLVLPDGSRVWLNAATTLQYPTAFTGGERKVRLTGEAYFDIAQDKAHPFIVETGGQRIAVLGTEFDVMGYEDEEVQRTTLVRGAVAVMQGAQKEVLAPGQQAIVQNDKPITVDADADIDKAIAWRAGFFMFDNMDIKMIMREIARWYDIEVVYRIKDYSGTLGGRISRNMNLKQLTEFLEGNGIYHYEIEGRKLIVLP